MDDDLGRSGGNYTKGDALHDVLRVGVAQDFCDFGAGKEDKNGMKSAFLSFSPSPNKLAKHTSSTPSPSPSHSN